MNKSISIFCLLLLSLNCSGCFFTMALMDQRRDLSGELSEIVLAYLSQNNKLYLQYKTKNDSNYKWTKFEIKKDAFGVPFCSDFPPVNVQYGNIPKRVIKNGLLLKVEKINHKKYSYWVVSVPLDDKGIKPTYFQSAHTSIAAKKTITPTVALKLPFTVIGDVLFMPIVVVHVTIEGMKGKNPWR